MIFVLQIIIGKDGICGIVCEHSGSEVITVLRFCDEFLSYLDKNPILGAQRKDSGSGCHNNANALIVSKKIQKLNWSVDEVLLQNLQESTKRINK